MRKCTRPGRRVLLGLWFGLIGVIFGGIFGSGLAGRPAAAADRDLRLAFPYKIQYLPLIIDTEPRPSGKAIIPVIGTGGIDAAEALLAGEADIGAMGDAPALTLLAKSARFQVICAFMQSPVMHRLIGRAGIDNLAALDGKRLAVHHGSSSHGALLAFLAEQGLDPGRIRLTPLAPVNFPEALLHGAVAAVAGSEPWPQNVLDRVPGSRELAVLTVAGNHFPHVLIADRELIAERQPEIRRFLRRLATVNQFIAADPAAAAAIAARFTNRPPAAELQAMAKLDYELDFSPAVAASLKQTGVFLQQERRLKRLPAAAALTPLTGLCP